MAVSSLQRGKSQSRMELDPSELYKVSQYGVSRLRERIGEKEWMIRKNPTNLLRFLFYVL